MSPRIGRRRLLKYAAAGLSVAAVPGATLAQTAVQRPPRQVVPDEFSVTTPVSIEVHARQLTSFDTRDRSRMRFGELEYRSGLILTSPFRGFGGLSGLRLDAKGERFIAISDKAGWFTGRIVYKGREMIGLDDVEASPILGPDGKPITSRRWFDTEALALDGPLVYVGLERVNQVLRFDFTKSFTHAHGEPIALPPAARKLPYNKGIEALVVVPRGNQPLAGTLIAISERGLDAQGNILGFLIGGKSPGQFTVRRTDDFDVSDAVVLPSGGLLVLERKFSWVGGVGIRIRRIALSSIAPGALIDGPSIFNADLGHEIDNMEGIDAHVTPEGDTVLTLVSDDNFSMIQRNLLLQFTLVE
ncbi:esterase-like activity of phytase family protein [Bradyrhizobium sp. CB3481]|uniref:esterase-like activity of phytase family protein n=1 Tax=Bradyrhizobium sp. CB3481 TaxID=3039158 RepID=UPI0024B24F16|nr:esterase-like activity of phytase family protein [Bradyrhizobium sp. CB3481]WFU16631.1 esterase-like activity of phytase family protein [Bradyrhizobium sp. CB3481]